MKCASSGWVPIGWFAGVAESSLNFRGSVMGPPTFTLTPFRTVSQSQTISGSAASHFHPIHAHILIAPARSAPWPQHD